MTTIARDYLGSSTGMGADMALQFAIAGASVTLHGRSKERMARARAALVDAGVSEQRILVVLGSIEDAETQRRLVDETLKRFGHIDILVSASGMGGRADAERHARSGQQCGDRDRGGSRLG